MRDCTKKKIILSILGIIFGFSLLISTNSNNYQAKENGNIKNENKLKLKRAGLWEIGPIEIDDSDPSKNWSITAATYNWCKGSGTREDPYIIENVTIDGQNLYNCIRIDNSDVYFTIRNCTLINGVGEYWHYGGIRLENVTNGKIFNNNCSFNQQGIYLTSSHNNTIVRNTANNNTIHGIILYEECNDNKIIRNTANFNAKDPTAGAGIRIKSSFRGYSYRNLIIGNNVSNNSGRGLDLTYIDDTAIINNTANNNGDGFVGDGIAVQASRNISISLNSVKGNGVGMFIYNNYHCKIFNNTAISNEYKGLNIERVINVTVAKNKVSYSSTGIFLRGSDVEKCYNNTISENNVNDNYRGIYLHRTDNNTILGNSIKENYIGIYLRRSNYNNVTGNILIGNDECIVEEECVGNIFENNNCHVGDIIPGYNLFYLLGILSVIIVLLGKKLKKS